MKRGCRYFLIMLFLPFVLGMGSMTGSDTPDKVPVTEKKFSATFVDQMDIITKCTEVSIEGKTFIEGRKGKGVYTIPFEEVESVTFLSKGEELRGLVRLRNKSSDELILDSSHKAHGRTAHGTFQIGIADIKKMIINE
ncbi:MAG: hypothetical protein JW724_01165 [Candidatus Altiarchaeota archaeon]|nr:hypothetical protein [Candidatus Altiarchaeota archaeon]